MFSHFPHATCQHVINPMSFLKLSKSNIIFKLIFTLLLIITYIYWLLFHHNNPVSYFSEQAAVAIIVLQFNSIRGSRSQFLYEIAVPGHLEKLTEKHSGRETVTLLNRLTDLNVFVSILIWGNFIKHYFYKTFPETASAAFSIHHKTSYDHSIDIGN